MVINDDWFVMMMMMRASQRRAARSTGNRSSLPISASVCFTIVSSQRRTSRLSCRMWGSTASEPRDADGVGGWAGAIGAAGFGWDGSGWDGSGWDGSG